MLKTFVHKECPFFCNLYLRAFYVDSISFYLLNIHILFLGTGRITAFNSSGDRPPDQGNIIVLISSNNLPASDDLPIIFVNIEKINNLPIDDFKSAR